MDVATASDPSAANADVLAAAVADEPHPDLGITELLAAEGFRPEAGVATLVNSNGRLVAVAGLGEEVDADSFRSAGAAVARLVQRAGGSVAWLLDKSYSLPIEEQSRAVVEGFVLGGYDAGRWKSGERDPGIDRLVLVGGQEEDARRTSTVTAWVNRARDLANEPANELTPDKLGARAETIAATSPHLRAEVSGRERLAELGMGAFGAVAQGSDNPPRLIVLRYDPPGARDDVVLGLVGKAVTFDTGGISIKPALYMEDMKGDKAGGAAVLAGIGAVAELGLPIRLMGVVGATENMVSGTSYRPGDIVRP